MTRLLRYLLYREPVALGVLLQAVAGIGIAFGPSLDHQQVAAIMSLDAAVIGLLVRSSVTPTPGPDRVSR